MARDLKLVLTNGEGEVLGEYTYSDYLHDSHLEFPHDPEEVHEELARDNMLDEIAHDVRQLLKKT